MKRFAFAVVAVLFLAPVVSARVSFSPLLPTDADRITVTIGGGWADGCVPSNPHVVVAGRQIAITLTPDRAGGCTLAPTSFSETVRLNELEPGVYEVVVLIVDGNETTTLDRRQLVVTDADAAFTVIPAVVPAGGGTVDIVATSSDRPLITCATGACETVAVFFGDSRAVGTVIDQLHVRVTAPPRDRGVVDVTVGEGTERLVSRLALWYTSAGEVPDPQSYETVLLPLVFNGPGAFGSEWRSEIYVRNNHQFATVSPARAIEFCPEIPVLINPPPPCGTHIPAESTFWLNATNRPRGLLLHLPRAFEDFVSFSAVVRDVSRADISRGAELPVVREKDFRTGSVDFLNVPFGDSRYRIKLRVYVPDADVAFLSYAVTGFSIESGGSLIARREALDEPAFATVDLPTTPVIDAPTRLRVHANGVGPFWAFLSITNNETQQVTILRPQ